MPTEDYACKVFSLCLRVCNSKVYLVVCQDRLQSCIRYSKVRSCGFHTKSMFRVSILVLAWGCELNHLHGNKPQTEVCARSAGESVNDSCEVRSAANGWSSELLSRLAKRSATNVGL